MTELPKRASRDRKKDVCSLCHRSFNPRQQSADAAVMAGERIWCGGSATSAPRRPAEFIIAAGEDRPRAGEASRGSGCWSNRAPSSSKAEIAERWVIVGTPPERPVILALAFLDRQVVDAGDAPAHQAVLVELPVLVAVAAEPAG